MKDEILLVPKDQPPDLSDLSSNMSDLHNNTTEIAEFSDEEEEVIISPKGKVVTFCWVGGIT